MAFTYSYPSHSQRDAVRFLVGDTTEDGHLLEDAEIDWLVTTWGSTYRAAAEACRVLATRFAEEADSKTVGPFSVSKSQAQGRYLEMAAAFEAKAKIGLDLALQPYSGGISKSDKELREQESDYDKPYFRRGMMDNPNSGLPSYLSST